MTKKTTAVVALGKPLEQLSQLTALSAAAEPALSVSDAAVRAATVKLLDALEQRARKTKRYNGTKPAVLEDDNEDDALPSGMPTLLLSDIGWGGADTERVEDRLYTIVNSAADTLVTQMSGQQFDGICLAMTGGLFSAELGSLMVAGDDTQVSEALTHLTDTLEQAVRFLSEHFAEVFIPCVCATGWSTKAEAPDDVATLLDGLVYQMLRARLADLIEKGRVAVEISQTSCLAYALYATSYLLVASGAPAARARISSPVMMPRGDAAVGGYDYVVTGNQGAKTDGAGYIANGAFKSKRSQQALWITHPAHGVSTMFSIAGEPRAADSELPAYRTLKPVSIDVRQQVALV